MWELTVMAVQNVRLFARLVLLRCVMANQYWIINAAFFCGKCVEACAAGALLHTDIDTLPEILTDVQMTIEREIRAKLGRSLHVRHLDAGSCNACDFEMGALSNPLYDLHRFGIAFVASPRHADMIMVTGVVTRNLAQQCK